MIYAEKNIGNKVEGKCTDSQIANATVFATLQDILPEDAIERIKIARELIKKIKRSMVAENKDNCLVH
jgi:hypothetical protein